MGVGKSLEKEGREILDDLMGKYCGIQEARMFTEMEQ